jgi:hypothetical protein
MSGRWSGGLAASALVGLLWAFTAAGIMTIGIFVAPFAAVATWLTVRFVGGRGVWGAALCGVALMPGWIAILNRDGPGNVCHSGLNWESCTEEMSPWPWAAAALVLFAAGVFLTVRRVRRHREIVGR